VTKVDGTHGKLTEYGSDKEEDSKWQPDYRSNIEVTILGSKVSDERTYF
jgi:hypothetical protein